MAFTVDARGLSCPQPVLLMRQALQQAQAGPVLVLVDSATQVENCTRAAGQLGWRVECEQKGSTFELTVRK
jgi:tRNA 2-thiouridine synthesizing protein A